MTIISMKLVSGEEVLATYEYEDSTTITVSKPRLASLVRQGQGVGISLFPWYVTAGDSPIPIQKTSLVSWLPEILLDSAICAGYQKEVSPIAVATGTVAQSILATP